MKVQNLLFLKVLVLLFSAILKKFGGLISNVMSQIESKNPHPLSPLEVKYKMVDQINRKPHQKRKGSTAFAVVEALCTMWIVTAFNMIAV